MFGFHEAKKYRGKNIYFNTGLEGSNFKNRNRDNRALFEK